MVSILSSHQHQRYLSGQIYYFEGQWNMYSSIKKKELKEKNIIYAQARFWLFVLCIKAIFFPFSVPLRYCIISCRCTFQPTLYSYSVSYWQHSDKWAMWLEFFRISPLNCIGSGVNKSAKLVKTAAKGPLLLESFWCLPKTKGLECNLPSVSESWCLCSL